MKFKVTRVWIVEAKTTTEAIKKSKNWKHVSVKASKIRRKSE